MCQGLHVHVCEREHMYARHFSCTLYEHSIPLTKLNFGKKMKDFRWTAQVIQVPSVASILVGGVNNYHMYI
jgi:hypothetical protein